MTLLAAFECLMSRYSGQEEMVVGTADREPEPGGDGRVDRVLREHAGAEDGAERGDPSFRELLKRVREVCLGAYAHQDVPFEKLVEELQPERDLSRSPLFQVMLVLQNAPERGLELGGMRLSGDERSGSADGEVRSDGGDHGWRRELVGVVEYSLDLFEEETIERLMGHYMNAAESDGGGERETGLRAEPAER